MEGGRAGMLGGTESVRVAAEMKVGRRETRRYKRSILNSCVEGEVAKVLILLCRSFKMDTSKAEAPAARRCRR